MAELDAQESITLGSDVPQSDPSDDVYGYANFGRQIAGAIRTTPSPHGLTMAVQGPWGIGKSTLLNFVKHNLTSEVGNDQILVIDFNPWWFNDKNHLVAQFLSRFQTALKLDPSALRKVGNLMAKYSKALGATVATNAGIPWASKPVAWVLSLFGLKTEDVPQLKARIAKALFDSNRRILFVIDDIDRLTPDEIRELFKVIKALADFPNVIYLLAFDRNVVQLALNRSLGIDGATYLEKIVQVSFSLPSIDQASLRRQLSIKLDRILNSFPSTVFDGVYWQNVYGDGLDHLIDKPRDIIRVTNALCVTYPSVAGEVNAVDYIALEFLRIFEPQVYEIIRDNQSMFVGNRQQNRDAQDPERIFHDSWLGRITDTRRPVMKALVSRIFPKVASTWGEAGCGSEWISIWRRELRVCCPDVFEIYFQFGMPSDYLSRAELNHLVVASKNSVDAAAILSAASLVTRADGRSKAGDYVERLRDLQDELTPALASGLLKALFEVGDHILGPNDGGQGFFSVPLHWRLGFLVSHLLKRIPEGDRWLEVRQLVVNGGAIQLIVTTVDRIRLHLEKPGNDHYIAFEPFDRAAFDDLKAIVRDRLNRKLSEDFLDLKDMNMVIYVWLNWGCEEEVRAKIGPLFEADALLPKLLEKFMNVGSSQVMGDHGIKRVVSINPKNLEQIIDIDAMEPRIRLMLNRSDLTVDQKAAGESYLENLTRIHNGGNMDGFDD